MSGRLVPLPHPQQAAPPHSVASLPWKLPLPKSTLHSRLYKNFSITNTLSASTSRDSRWSLQGMTALVTGGTRGIGHAIVEELAGLGANVHTCARNETELSKCLKGWEDGEKSFQVTGSVCDVSSRMDREKLMDSISSLFNGKLNILVNNVGTNIRKPMIDLTAEEFSTLVSTNFESVFELCQLAYPLLKASGVGSVVFTSSVSGFVSLKSMSVRGATKGAINQLTKVWHVNGQRTTLGVMLLHLST